MVNAEKLAQLRRREFPWCTLFLVISATVCHACVLAGNFKTASALEELGTSTNGWSKIGIGVAQALEVELNERMQNVSAKLLDGLSHVTVVQEAVEAVLSMIGLEADDVLEPGAREAGQAASTDAGDSSLYQSASARQRRALSGPAGVDGESAGEDRNMTDAFDKLAPVVLGAVHNVLSSMVNKVSELLVQMFEKLKPALEQVGEWIIKFGDKIQSGLSIFSVTVDRVQKMFDQIMSKLNGYGENEEELLDQTFNLFDVSNTGAVTAQDLKDVSSLYSITALQGDLAIKLVNTYDEDGDGKLTKEELLYLVNDPAIPDSMIVVLRTYAQRLAEVAGIVSSARQRDEVAKAVADYLELVCAKNQTKVGWIADRLGNGSLPLEFTGDVFVELCLAMDDPNKLTTSDVGAGVVGIMYDLHPEHTLAAVEMLSNSTYWLAEGFEAADQPVCVKRVTDWVTRASSVLKSNSSEALSEMGERSVTELLLQAKEVPMHPDLLKTFPSVLEEQCESGIARRLHARKRERDQQRGARFSSKTSQLLLNQLLSGVPPTDSGAPSVAEQAVKQGVPARPETLEFARWLSYNATRTAAMFQDMCFVYSSSSSSAVDSIAAHIQGVVSQTKGFIDMMMRYATPAAIERLEDQIAGFTENALDDVQKIIEKRVAGLINQSSDIMSAAIHKATHRAGEQLGRMLGKLVSSPLGEALHEPMEHLMGDMVRNPKVGDKLGEKLGQEVADAVSNLTAEALASKTGDILEDLVEAALNKGGDLLEGAIDKISDKFGDAGGLLQERSAPESLNAVQQFQERRRQRRRAASLLQEQASVGKERELLEVLQDGGGDGLPDILDHLPHSVSGAWEAVVNLLKSLVNLLPAAVQALKNARREVCKLYAQLTNSFVTFEVRGPPIFDNAAFYWRTLWSLYFFCMLPLSCFTLYYGMWAGGYFGGPTPNQPDEDAEYARPQTWVEKIRTCCAACSACMKNYHDTQLCFWSTILLLEVVVLVIFAVSIVLCVLGGIKVLLVTGCNEVYILHDEMICTETLHGLRKFLDTFMLDESMRPLNDVSLDEACGSYRLLTCEMISQKMKVSTALTTIFSFLATLISLQLIIDSAVLHEQATFRRLANELVNNEEVKTATQASASGSSA